MVLILSSKMNRQPGRIFVLLLFRKLAQGKILLQKNGKTEAPRTPMYPHLEGEELKEAVWEELLADAYAEYNRYGKETLPGLSEEVQKLTWAGEEKNTGRKGGQRYLISDTFVQDVASWLEKTKESDRVVSPGYFRIGTTSEPLKSIGVRDGNIYWRKSKIGYILSDHPEISDNTIMEVPDILEQPILIMKSLTRDDSIVLFGNVYAENGARVMAALELTPRAGGNMEAEFSLVTSTYARSKENVQNLLRNSEILYIDENKERANTWLMQLGVQFPSRQPAYGSIGSVAYEADGVKITGKTLLELGGVISKKTEEADVKQKFSAASEGTEKRTAESMRDEALEAMPSFSHTPHSVPRNGREESKFAEKLTDEERAVVEQAMEKREKTEKKSIFEMTIEEMMIPKEGFTSTPAIDKLGVKVAGSVARYRSTEDLKAYELKRIIKVATEPNGVLFLSKGLTDGNVTTTYTVSDLFKAVKRYDRNFNPKEPSKVVNDDGTPMVVYHGTSDYFTEFKTEELSSKEGSFFFAQNREDAEAYTSTGNVLEVYVNLKNPIDYNNMPSEIYMLWQDMQRTAGVESLLRS